MGIKSKNFEGISTNIPGIYSKSEFPPSLGASGISLNIVAVIGLSKGGIPYNATGLTDPERVNVISSVAQALDTLEDDDGFYMTEFYLSPSNDAALNAPTACLMFRVDPAIQAASTLQDGSSNDIIDLVSLRYGTSGNQTARKVEAATNLGHKVTIKYKGVILAEQNDIGLEYLEIQYSGAGSAAEMNITALQLDTTVTAGSPEEDLVLLFADFPKLGDLVEYINEQPAFTCILKAASDILTTTFDAVTAQDIKTAAYTAVAHVEALIQFFNAQSQNEISASLTSAAIRTDVENDANFVFMTAGSKGAAASTDWGNTLTLMEKFRINHILVATGDAAIQAMVNTHINRMSSIEGKRNRTASSGSVAGQTLALRYAEAKALNNARFEYHFTPFSRFDLVNNNVKKSFAPFLGAAFTAGIRYGNNTTISATFKTINVLSIDESYSNPEKKTIIGSGGTLFGEEERGFTVTHNVSTYQGENLILNLPSMLRTTDAITLDSQSRIQTRLASLLTAADALIIEDTKNFLTSNLLPGYRDSQKWLTDDPITGDSAFSDVEFTLSGDSFEFKFTGIVPAPLHFGFIKQKFVVVGSRSA